MAMRTVLLLMLFLPVLLVRGEAPSVSAPGIGNSVPKVSLPVGFLNRYAELLNAPRTDAVSDSLRRVKDDGFVWTVGNDGVFRSLSGREDFALSFDDGIYTARWSIDGKTKASCSFPANIGLLTFSSKIDLEDRMIALLQSLAGDTATIALPRRDRKDLTPVSLSDFYTEDHGFYITPRLKNELVFSPEEPGDTCSLLIDSNRYQLESIANMMLTGYSAHPLNIYLNVSRYGYKTVPVTLSLAALFNALSAEGSVPYWGVDTFDGKTVKGLYVWLNPAGGFAHMLSLTLPVESISSPTVVEAKLHCYLRLDNLKSMFEEYPEL